MNDRADYFGNQVRMFMVQHTHTELSMVANSVVDTWPSNVPIADATPAWEIAASQLALHDQPGELEAYQFIFESPLTSVNAAIKDFAMPSFPSQRPILEAAMDLMGRIFAEFAYDKAATSVETAVEQVLRDRKGVCQDFAHLTISCLRSLGLAARYVSGYLETQPPPGTPRLVGADASHAWLSLYVPQAGWVDLDPTNNLIPGERHITLAWGRDYGDVTPVKGVVMGGGKHTLSVKVDVAAQQ
jgi:transglutaminase-like putative cysteine protease